MQLASGRLGDGVWSRTISDKKREEEQSVVGFADNDPPLPSSAWLMTANG